MVAMLIKGSTGAQDFSWRCIS